MKKLDLFMKHDTHSVVSELVKTAKKVLLVTHNDMDASGAVICCMKAFGPENVDVVRCSNRQMSREIKNAVCNEEIADHYDLIMACDISCTEEDAQIINKSPNKKKFILLDHHHTALSLNKYAWATVHEEILTDSKRARRYEGHAGGHSSGTSLMHDFLGLFKHDYNDISFGGSFALEELVFSIASYDTWDWVNVFEKKDDFPDRLDTLFKIYGAEDFEKKMFSRVMAKDAGFSSKEDLLDEQDAFLLKLEKKRVNDFLEKAKWSIKTGTMKVNGEYADVVFATETAYVQELFGYMRDHYPDADYYFINCGGVLSIRTTKEDRHAGDFAARYGGGGHQGAAGINVSAEMQADYLGEIIQGEIYLDDRDARMAKYVESPENENEEDREER